MLKAQQEKENNANTQALPKQQITMPEVYTNTAIVNISPYEFELTFGLGSSNYEGIKPVVNVRMSPQFAKELAKTLVDNINLYQENYGKIEIPKKEE